MGNGGTQQPKLSVRVAEQEQQRKCVEKERLAKKTTAEFALRWRDKVLALSFGFGNVSDVNLNVQRMDENIYARPVPTAT